MVTYLLKKSYQHKTLKEVKFKDLWGDKGVFTTMWILGKPAKILFFKKHIKNLIKSLKVYKLNKNNIERDVLRLIRLNIDKTRSYNHLFRVAINKRMISVSLRERKTPKLKFNLKLINYKRIDPEIKNLKYKFIIKHLSKMDNTTSDVGLCFEKKILESGTSNIFFVSKEKIYSPINNIYKGITFQFFEKKVGNILKKNIFVKTLNNFEEIILVGSGKGVVSIKSIKKPYWHRKSSKIYRLLSKIYLDAVTNCPPYNG